MKNICNILFIVFSCYFMAACDNYDYNDKVSSVKITSADTAIPAAGGTKSIGIKSQNKITAYSKDNWLKVSCEGDSVKLNAGENEVKESRHTTVVVKSGKDSTVVDVSQYGIAFSLDVNGNAYTHDGGASRSYKLKCNVPLNISTDENWISGKYTEDSLYVTTLPNTTGKPRWGYLICNYGNMKDSVKVIQLDATDLAGNWKFECQKGTSNDNPITLKDTIYNVTAKANATNDSLYISMYDGAFTMHAAINEGKLVLNGGDYMGPYESDYAFLCLMDYKQGYLTWATNRTYEAAYNENRMYTYYEFEDNGSWAGYTVTGIDVTTFYSMDDLSSYTIDDEGLLYLLDPIMYREN